MGGDLSEGGRGQWGPGEDRQMGRLGWRMLLVGQSAGLVQREASWDEANEGHTAHFPGWRTKAEGRAS